MGKSSWSYAISQTMPDEEFRNGEVLIQNYEGSDVFDGMLSPYEAYVIYTE